MKAASEALKKAKSKKRITWTPTPIHCDVQDAHCDSTMKREAVNIMKLINKTKSRDL